jgi:hypothetical protein
MAGLIVVLVYAVPIALVIAAVVWALNMGLAVRAIEATLRRMEAGQVAMLAERASASSPAPSRTSAAIDIEPFVD